MFALLGSLVGFISSLAPDIFGLLRDKKDKAHELQILDRQMELTKLGHTTRMERFKLPLKAKKLSIFTNLLRNLELLGSMALLVP